MLLDDARCGDPKCGCNIFEGVCPRCHETGSHIDESAFVSGYACNVCELGLEEEHLATVSKADCTNPFCAHFSTFIQEEG